MKLDELRTVISRVEDAMRAEGVNAETVRRVINTLMYGHPDGSEARLVIGDGDERVEFTEPIPDAVARQWMGLRPS